MKENPLFYARLSLQVVYLLKMLKYFEVRLNAFEFFYVKEIVES